MLEMSNSTAEIRPVFSLASLLETKWFSFSAEKNWLIFVKTEDEFQAILEVDL